MSSTPAPDLRRGGKGNGSSRSPHPSGREWGSDFQSRARSSNSRAGAYGRKRHRRAVRRSTSHCAPSRRRRTMAADHTVHVIDDDSAVRESLAFLLGAANISVKTYDSAMSFLEALPQVEDGCIVTD